MPIYLISKALDPAFALAMGTAAALVRIRREEKEKHPDAAADIGFGTVLSLGGSRLGKWWGGEFDSPRSDGASDAAAAAGK